MAIQLGRHGVKGSFVGFVMVMLVSWRKGEAAVAGGIVPGPLFPYDGPTLTTTPAGNVSHNIKDFVWGGGGVEMWIEIRLKNS